MVVIVVESTAQKQVKDYSLLTRTLSCSITYGPLYTTAFFAFGDRRTQAPGRQSQDRSRAAVSKTSILLAGIDFFRSGLGIAGIEYLVSVSTHLYLLSHIQQARVQQLLITYARVV